MDRDVTTCWRLRAVRSRKPCAGDRPPAQDVESRARHCRALAHLVGARNRRDVL